MILVNFYKKLLKIGLSEEVAFKEGIRIELCNQFVATGLTLVFLHLIVGLVFIRSVPDFILTFIWFVLLSIGLILNLLHRFSWSRSFLVFSGIITVFVLHILFGPQIRLESMYILFAVCAVLFFDFKLMVKTGTAIVLAFLLAIYICSVYDSPFADYVSPTGPITRFIFSAFMILSLISKLILENWAYNSVVQKQNEKLTEAYQQLKSFNYIISHDLKEPIRSIVSFSQLINRDLEKSNVNREFFEHIISSGKRMYNLLEDIKDFQDSSEKTLQFEQVHLEEVVEDVKLYLKESIDEQGAQVHCQNLPTFYSSKAVLFIVFKNLIDNAIRYNDSEQPTIFIDGMVSDAQIELRVKDNGIGIDRKYFDQVFLLFKRLHSNEEKGSGLGLNIVQNLLKRMRGSIDIQESKPGAGTTFLIRLPVQESLQS